MVQPVMRAVPFASLRDDGHQPAGARLPLG
jgi:hypothetical protein